VSEANDSCVVAAILCEEDLGIAYEVEGEREIEHALNLDCDSLPCRGYCGACTIVLYGRRRAK
jgi:hypothetical protein